MTIRFASVEDAASLLRIYAQYINTAITFEYALPTEQEFARRIAEICADYPYLICEEEGRPIGYAYAHRQMECGIIHLSGSHCHLKGNWPEALRRAD